MNRDAKRVFRVNSGTVRCTCVINEDGHHCTRAYEVDATFQELTVCSSTLSEEMVNNICWGVELVLLGLVWVCAADDLP